MGKAWALFVTFSLILGVMLPIHEDFRGAYGDSFPFSWYPMFSRPRPDPDRTNYVYGLTKEGKRQTIVSRHYVSGGMNQARRQLSRMVETSEGAKKVCERAAKAAAKRKSGAMSEIERVRVVRAYFHMEKYFGERDKTPVREEVYATCMVRRNHAKASGFPKGDRE